MTATITKIDNIKRGNGTEFKRVYFKTEAGDWAKTDVCPEYRNYRRWEPLLAIGTLVGNLSMKDATTVDADSRPTLVRKPQPPPAKQLDLL